VSVAPTAIILAAGVGKRFGGVLVDLPKGLLEVGGETLLGRLLRQLRVAGVDRATIVVGHGGDRVVEALSGASDTPALEFVRNPDYRRGAILSLWCARERLSGPAIVMDADVWGPDAMIARLVASPHASCFLLDARSESTGEEQMLMVRDGRVLDIARRPRGAWDLLGESVGFLKLSGEAARTLRDLLGERVGRDEVDLEHEEVYPDLMRRVPIGFERADDLDWTEIDFPADLERARSFAAKAARGT